LGATLGAAMVACGEPPGADQGAEQGIEETSSALVSGKWATLTNPLPANLDTCVQIPNGDVMCHGYNTNTWHRLRPDTSGSYKNGTWDTPPIAPMPNGNDPGFNCSNCTYAPRAFASAVLKDGRVIVMGGEYVSDVFAMTNIGFIYNPLTDKWSSQVTSAFPGGVVGDAMGINFADGTFAIANIDSGDMQVLNPTNGVFTAKNATGKIPGDKNDEENWSLLFDGTILTVDGITPSSSERYNPSTNSWTHSPMPVNLTDFGPGTGSSEETGPCAMTPYSKLICFSGNPSGKNAIYDTSNNTWSHPSNSVDFRDTVAGSHFSVADGPAATLPDGNVLVMASPVTTTSATNTPSRFYEVDVGNSLIQQVDSTAHASSLKSFQGHMLVLPTGEVLLTAFNGSVQDVALYTAAGGPLASYRPTITNAPSTITGGSTFTITGKQLNGWSYGATYGDDAQSATNFPLVRLTNQATGHVFYARTFNFSSMGIQKLFSTTLVSASFEVPVNIEPGATSLEVVANGIASNKQTVTAQAGSCPGPGIGELHFVDPANGTDDLNHGGNFGSCGYKTLTYALAHATGQIALQTATYSPSTETFPIVLHGVQQILCQYTTASPATISGKGLYTPIEENISVAFEGTQNALFSCVVNGGGGIGYCVVVNSNGSAFPQTHAIEGSNIGNCGGSAVEIEDNMSNISIDNSTLHDSLLGTFWAGTNTGGNMSNNTFTNNTTDIQCQNADLGVNGSGNHGSVNGKPSCVTCGHCSF
jgi:hypothetical protein